MVHFAWCTFCGKRYTKDEVEEIKDVGTCPKCGSKNVPCFTDQDVSVEINWHELHILCVWAENYQNQIEEQEPIVSAIARRLQIQHPNLGPLTLSGELHLIKSMPGISNVETNIPGPKLLPVHGNGAVGYGKGKE